MLLDIMQSWYSPIPYRLFDACCKAARNSNPCRCRLCHHWAVSWSDVSMHGSITSVLLLYGADQLASALLRTLQKHLSVYKCKCRIPHVPHVHTSCCKLAIIITSTYSRCRQVCHHTCRRRKIWQNILMVLTYWISNKQFSMEFSKCSKEPWSSRWQALRPA